MRHTVSETGISRRELKSYSCVVLVKIHAVPLRTFFLPLGNCDSALQTTEEWKYGSPQLLELRLLYARYVA